MAIGHIFKQLPQFQVCKDGTYTSNTTLMACQWHKGVNFGLPPVTYNSFDKPHEKLENVYAIWFDIDKIHTDVKRFQNRDSDYSEESVNKIVSSFDINQLSPIDIWLDPTSNKWFVLSGHSRLEAHKRLQKKRIPVKYFQGSEKEAITYAKVYANRGATKESLTEDIKAYTYMRDVEKLSKDTLKSKFKEYSKLEAYSFLNPAGQFLNILNHEAKAQYPFIENKATWAGLLRKNYPSLSNQHENEMFDFFFGTKEGFKSTKDEFFARVEKKLARFDFNYSENLQLAKGGETGTEARQDTSEAQKRIYAIEKELTELHQLAQKVKTKEEKQSIKLKIDKLTLERERLARDISLILKTQSSLFGVVEQHYKTNEIKGYNGEVLQELARELTKPLNKSKLSYEGGYTDNIVTEILEVFAETYLETKQLSKYFAGVNEYETVKNVWRFVKENIRYVLDPVGIQLIKTPSRTVHDDFADCKGYSILKASILENLGYQTFFRFTSYSHFSDVTHIYVIVKHKGKTYVCDACWHEVNKEKPYTFHFDKRTI